MGEQNRKNQGQQGFSRSGDFSPQDDVANGGQSRARKIDPRNIHSPEQDHDFHGDPWIEHGEACRG